MPEIKTALSPAEALDRIEQFVRDWNDPAQLPQTLRDQRVARIALHDRTGAQLTIRLALAHPSKLLRYCDVHADATNGGSVVRYTLRGPWNPKVAGGLVLGLLCIQMIYQLITGTFDRVMLIIATVVPAATAYLAHLDTKTIRKKYQAGMLDLLQMALHIVPANPAASTMQR